MYISSYFQGTSRGGADMKEIVRRIDLWGLNMVFVIGGNGGNAGRWGVGKKGSSRRGGGKGTNPEWE
jgi:hypothetical protein